MCLAAMSGVKSVVPGRVFSGSLSNESLSSQEKIDLADLFQSLQTQSCVKARERCQKKTVRSDEPVCRVMCPNIHPVLIFLQRGVHDLSAKIFELMHDLELVEFNYKLYF